MSRQNSRNRFMGKLGGWGFTVVLAAFLMVMPGYVSQAADQDAGSAPSYSGSKIDDSCDAIAELSELVGNMSLVDMSEHLYVDVNSDTSPYDLEWHYSPKPSDDLTIWKTYKQVTSEEWAGLWESYVDACDWNLVFDADFYMEAFPMLAKLYDYDKEALLRHYQTVGIHEGRQASEAFCPAAYMDRCSQGLKDGFGDNPECYIIYYMLHRYTENKIDARNMDGNYPLWLSVEMSYAQENEIEKINGYRKEVGVDPVEPHPELMALANLRCRIDVIGGYNAHEWLDVQEAEAISYLDVLDIDYWAENTIKKPIQVIDSSVISGPYLKYRYSESHYEAMVSREQRYAGCSNFYGNTDWGKSVHFDIYVHDCPKPDGKQ